MKVEFSWVRVFVARAWGSVFQQTPTCGVFQRSVFPVVHAGAALARSLRELARARSPAKASVLRHKAFAECLGNFARTWF